VEPATDPPSPALRRRAPGRQAACRQALQAELGLAADDDALLLVVVSRLTAQKGLDLLLAPCPTWWPGRAGGGAGHRRAGAGGRLPHGAAGPPGRVHVHIGYDEARAHRWSPGPT
jgi:starch synthase